jgi:membrane-bound serine protease (ClpP class)
MGPVSGCAGARRPAFRRPAVRVHRAGMVHRAGIMVLSALVMSTLVLFSSALAGQPVSTDPVRNGRVLVTTVDGAITPVIADHIRDGIARAERGGYQAYVVRLDTPGGLDTSMRAIVQHIYASEVPVIVHVAPPGARGASAGAIITFAAHVAAMAPGTSIGAATPVAGGGGEDLDAKVINDAAAYAESIAELRGRDRLFIVDTVREGRSASAVEALELGAIDLIASSTEELLEASNGLIVSVGVTDREVELRTAGTVVDDHDMGIFRSIQQLLADPNVAFLLLSIGTLGLIYELASPGLGVGAVLGTTFVVLGLFGLAVLSVNLVGVVFLLLAAALFVAEIFAPGVGLAAAGGVFALVMSGVFLFDDAPGLQISLAVILPVAVVVGAFVFIAGRIAVRVRHVPSVTTGVGLLVDHEGLVRVQHGHPQIFLSGAWWSVRPGSPGTALVDGTLVRVTDVDGLTLIVEPVMLAPPDPNADSSAHPVPPPRSVS